MFHIHSVWVWQCFGAILFIWILFWANPLLNILGINIACILFYSQIPFIYRINAKLSCLVNAEHKYLPTTSKLDLKLILIEFIYFSSYSYRVAYSHNKRICTLRIWNLSIGKCICKNRAFTQMFSNLTLTYMCSAIYDVMLPSLKALLIFCNIAKRENL